MGNKFIFPIMVEPEDIACGLSGNTLLVMSAIRTFINHSINKEIVISLKMFCDCLNLKARTVKRLVHSLTMTGHVEILNPEDNWDKRIYKIPERDD